jgi:rubrerythrin
MEQLIVSPFAGLGDLRGDASAKAARVEYHCRDCGYGIVVSRPPPDGCPMCRATSWIPIGQEGR